MNKEQKILAALAYILWPVALVLLIIEEAKVEDKSKQLRHHAFNALGFWVVVLIMSLLVSIFSFVPLFGYVAAALFLILVIVLAILYALKAYQGQKVEIPYVTDFLRKNVKDF